MDLSDIKASLSTMSEEELHDLLMGIRSNRRVTKRPPSAAKVSKSEVSADTLIKGMSPEQAAVLLAMMDGKKC